MQDKARWANPESPNMYAMTLTPRQTEILALVAQGLVSREIGPRLGISWRTVDTLVDQSTGRLGARNRTHAVAIAIGEGLIEPVDV